MFGRHSSPAQSSPPPLVMVGFGPPGGLNEFRADSGEYVFLHDFWCTDIMFRPSTCQLFLTFRYADELQGDGTGSTDDDLTVVMTFHEAEILSWEDEGDGPGGLPSTVDRGVRGQVENLTADNGVVTLELLNVEVTFAAARVTYEVRH